MLMAKESLIGQHRDEELPGAFAKVLAHGFFRQRRLQQPHPRHQLRHVTRPPTGGGKQRWLVSTASLEHYADPVMCPRTNFIDSQ